MAMKGFIISWPVGRNAMGAAIQCLLLHVFCTFVSNYVCLLQLMALLLLRHSLTINNGEDDDDASTFFSVSGVSSMFGPTICFLWLH